MNLFLFVSDADAHHKGKHSARFNTVMLLKDGMVKKGHGSAPLASHVFELEAAAWRHGVSPFAIAAISAVESTFGHNGCPGNPRNIWGLGACGSAWNEPYFSTWKQAFNYMAVFLKRTWPNADSVYELYGYCSGCPWWYGKVAWYMGYFWNRGPGLFYGKNR